MHTLCFKVYILLTFFAVVVIVSFGVFWSPIELNILSMHLILYRPLFLDFKLNLKTMHIVYLT